MKRIVITLMLVCLIASTSIFAKNYEVTVTYQNDTASVKLSPDLDSFVTYKVIGSDVEIAQSSTLTDEITYRLSGIATNGSLLLTGDYKITLSLEGLRLESQKGAAIQIKNGKRIAVVLKDGTENVLTDMQGGVQKACMIVKGHTEFQGGGSLTINARGKHALKSNEYVELKAGTGTITMNSSTKDGIHTDEYVLIQGGTLRITTTGSGCWDDEDLKTKAPACINAAGHVTINGGVLDLLSTGDGGKGIKSDSIFSMNDGELTIRTLGARYIYELYDGDKNDIDNIPDSLKNSPKAVTADMGVCVNGGKLTIFTEKDGGEGLESKDTLTIKGGTLHIEAFDDCVNAAGNVRISGGDLYLTSLDNDGLDTNQSMYITGGNIVTLGNYLHELGIDVNDRSPYKKLYLTGGTVICVGGTTQVVHPFASDDAQPAVFYQGKINARTQLLLSCTTDATDVLRYQLNRDYTQEAGGIQPELCLMFSSPLLRVDNGYSLINETADTILGSVKQLETPYSNLNSDSGTIVNADIFEYDSFTWGSTTLPYRRAEINHASALPALIVYLHEAPSRGTDNIQQLKEVAVDSIYRYLCTHNISATFIVPQCPATTGWTGHLRRVVYELMKSYVSSIKADVSRIYITGNSIGATGVWCQLSNYPNFYAAAMPIAGDPSSCNAQNVATTPVYCVMGTDDTVMPLSNVEAFRPEVINTGGTFQLDVIAGWDHKTTCDHSYTTDRLDWLFSQSRDTSTGVDDIRVIHPSDNKLYDLSGREVSSPEKGIYIKDGRKIVF